MKLCLGEYTRPVYESLLAEASQPAPPKARVSVGFEEDCVSLLVEAESLSRLRAVLNSYAYLAYAMYSALAELRGSRETQIGLEPSSRASRRESSGEL